MRHELYLKTHFNHSENIFCKRKYVHKREQCVSSEYLKLKKRSWDIHQL